MKPAIRLGATVAAVALALAAGYWAGTRGSAQPATDDDRDG